MSRAKFTTDALASNLRGQQLSTASLERYAPSSSKVTFEPTLTGSVSNPTGWNAGFRPAANILTATWVRQDDVVNMWFTLLCHSTFNPGSGYWLLSLPVEADATFPNVGSWSGVDANTGNYAEGSIWVFSPTAVVFYYPATAPIGTFTALGAAAPWTWATNDRFNGHLTYVAA